MPNKLLLIICAVTFIVASGCNSAVEDIDSTGSKLQLRNKQNLLALYTFNERSGNTVHDVSGIEPALDLTIDDMTAVEWIDNGLSISAETLIRSSENADKINNAVSTNNAVTVEAWVKPANTTQSGPSRIVSISMDPSARNITLAQSADTYLVRLNTTTNSSNGTPSLQTPTGVVTTELTHLAFTWDVTSHNATIYVNGTAIVSLNNKFTGDLSNWRNYKLVLSTEFENDNPNGRFWFGEMYLVAIYDRALSAEEIRSNYDLGF